MFLVRCSSTPVSGGDPAGVAARIGSLLETDQRVSNLLSKHRGEMLEAAHSERRAAGNVNRYLENAS